MRCAEATSKNPCRAQQNDPESIPNRKESRMTVLAAIFGILVLLIILWDGFEVIILPRRVARRLRLSRLFYLSTWTVCSWMARRVHNSRRRERLLRDRKSVV